MIISAQEAKDIFTKEKYNQLSDEEVMKVVVEINQRIKIIAKKDEYIEYNIGGRINNKMFVQKVAKIFLELKYNISIDKYEDEDDEEVYKLTLDWKTINESMLVDGEDSIEDYMDSKYFD